LRTSERPQMCDPTFPEAADEGWWGIAFSHFTGSRRLHSGGRYFSRRNPNAYLVLLVTSEVQVDQHVKPPFEAVVQQHGATVLRVVRAVVGHADADDAWSDTFLAALKAYPQLPADANVEAWLVTIAHRKAIDITRGNSRRAVPVADTSDSPGPGSRALPGAVQIIRTTGGTTGNFCGWQCFAPSKRHGVIRVVKSRGRVMLDLPLTWSDLGDGSASLPYWPHMV